jgi:hypothetical protein
MKPHIQRELVNELTKIAKQYYNTQQLRDRISHTVSQYLEKEKMKYNKKIIIFPNNDL